MRRRAAATDRPGPPAPVASTLARLVCGLALAAAAVRPVAAHPAPFSYVDLRIGERALEGTLVIHVDDLAHDLPDEADPPPGAWLDPAVLAARADAAVALLGARFVLRIDDDVREGEWLAPEPSDDTDAVRFRVRYPLEVAPGRIAVEARLFPYDPLHQTFVNVYDRGELDGQAVLSGGQSSFTWVAGERPGVWTSVRRFVPSGIGHILIGPDHLLFLVGLLLLGGTLKRLALVVTAFTVAHSVTLSLAALELVMPPPALIEPAIALSIVYVGIDNLLAGGGRDTRTWIAFGFGLIHGFGFANVLREMALPRAALLSSLVSFNVGVEIGQLAVVVLVAGALAALRARSARAGRLVAAIGSVVVIAAGTYWFVARVFITGV